MMMIQAKVRELQKSDKMDSTKHLILLKYVYSLSLFQSETLVLPSAFKEHISEQYVSACEYLSALDVYGGINLASLSIAGAILDLDFLKETNEGVEYNCFEDWVYILLTRVQHIGMTYAQYRASIGDCALKTTPQSAPIGVSIKPSTSKIQMSLNTGVSEGAKAPANAYSRYLSNEVNEYTFLPNSRDKELDTIQVILQKDKRKNLFLLGDAGSGKTALIHELAVRYPAQQILSVDCGAILAGTQYRGDLERRLTDIFKNTPTQQVLYFDEFHLLGHVDNVVPMFLTFAGSGKHKIILSTTHRDYDMKFQKNDAFMRRFEVVALEPLSRDVLATAISSFISNSSYQSEVSVSDKYVFDIMDVVGKYRSKKPLLDTCLDLTDHMMSACSFNSSPTLDRNTVLKLLKIDSTQDMTLTSLKSLMRQHIFGQDEAIDKITRPIGRYLRGMHKKNSPIGTFLLTGETGTGKTETAKQISKALQMPLIKLNMSDYKEKSSVSGLLGASAGYIGYDSGGVLTSQILKYGRAVLILDEVEKAHPEIYDIFLNMIDEGYIIDSRGIYVDCTNLIIFMTTNISVAEQTKSPMGFNTPVVSDTSHTQGIEAYFKPEFLARLTDIVFFKSISEEMAVRMIGKYIEQAIKTIDGFIITIHDDLPLAIVGKALNKKLGGRGVLRYLEDKLLDPLCAFLDDVMEGSEIIITAAQGDISFQCKSKPKINKRNKKDC